jgi:uncharacterized protein YidB (DUF937 family)
MGIFDALAGVLGGAMRQRGASAPSGQPQPGSQPAGFPSSFSEILESSGFGNLSGVVQRLSNGGLNEHVASWLGQGANLPVTPDQLRNALGSEQVQRIGQKLGIPTDKLLQILSQYLPAAVDQASPNGRIEESDRTAH